MKQQTLLEVFGQRPTRMNLLKDSLDRIELPKDSHILEAGCSFGDGVAFATEYVDGNGFGIDITKEYVDMAGEKHKDIEFTCGSVYDLEFKDREFDLVFSQAAFSLLTEKENAINEYHRTLKPGGHVIINDFVIKEPVPDIVLAEMDFIPCFNSVGTIEEYVQHFEKAGFEVVLAKDCYKEIISTTLHLTKEYKCTPQEMTVLFSQILGNSEDSVEKGRCFFKRAKISYGQLIFRKV